MAKTQNNYRRVRLLIGTLGMLLPVILPIFHGYVNSFTGGEYEVWLRSISHYNYSYASVIFTGVLMSFGLLLMSYKGYPDGTFWVRDDTVTSLSGALAIVVALIPTLYDNTLMSTPNAHDKNYLSLIHLISAGAFLILLGVMSAHKFTMGRSQDVYHVRRRRAYRTLGYTTILSILTLAVLFALKLTNGNTVFIFEAIALFAFGFAWLLKGKAAFFVALGLITRDELIKARSGDEE